MLYDTTHNDSYNHIWPEQEYERNHARGALNLNKCFQPVINQGAIDMNLEPRIRKHNMLIHALETPQEMG